MRSWTRFARGDLTAGHARALLPLGDEHLQVDFARQVGDQEWSVRETERQVQEKIRAEDREPLTVVGGAPEKKANPERAGGLVRTGASCRPGHTR